MKQFFDKRIVFIGDAAHALTPNLGQGACQAIEDAIILAECIKNNAHYRQAFLEYEQNDEIELKKSQILHGKLENGTNRK